MRSWYLSRVALERRLEPPPDPSPSGVYDRRPTPTMLIARIISGLLAFTAVLLSLTTGPTASPYTLSDSHSPPTSPHHHPATSLPPSLNPPILISAPDGTQAVLQRPHITPRGTILLLHGCSHSATDYFPPTAHCPACLGLPQNRRLADLALQWGYNVVAVSSTDRAVKCWRTNGTGAVGADYDRVRTALEYARVHGAYGAGLPLYAVGGSSGGYFASSLPLGMAIQGVYVIISGVVWMPRGGEWNRTMVGGLPAHVFGHMGGRDVRTAGRVKEARSALGEVGVASAEFSMVPKRVTAGYLMEAEPRWNESVVGEVVAALRGGGFLDVDGFLKADPRRSAWRGVVEHLKGRLGDSLVADQSALSSELNRAWGQHETSAEYFEQALAFLEREGGAPVA
eukprot:GFKZ01007170.1.p1 GENE.GFKZ01007170.1~~GFKZ01007170.1.p1  ORF type:complete len:432 (-),score=39.81 GFKZ01007170.1:166-1356(-)